MLQQKLYRGLAVLICAFPRIPSQSERQSMQRFLQHVYDATKDHRKFSKNIFAAPPAVLHTRMDLRSWFFNNWGRKIWHGVSGILASPRLWGPHVWAMLHVMSAFPETAESKRAFVGVLRELPNRLPCASCAEHFRALLHKHRIFGLMHDPVRMTVKLHNLVNLQTKSGQLLPVRATPKSFGQKIRMILQVKPKKMQLKPSNKPKKKSGCGCGKN